MSSTAVAAANTGKSLSLVIEAGLDHSFHYQVEKDYVILYKFKTSDYIYFSIRYDDNKTNKSLVWTLGEEGSFHCTRPGKVTLEFDNSASWLRGVSLTLKVDIEKPLDTSLEKPIYFHVFPSVKFTEEIEKFIFRIPTSNGNGTTITTNDILSSGKRLIAFEDSLQCTKLTGRPIDFSLGPIDAEKELLARLGNDLHPFLYAKQNNKKPPKMVLGTMTFDDIREEATALIVKAYNDFSPECDELDTAYAYGKSEAILGKLIIPKYPKMTIATKVNPWPHSGKSFSPKDIRTQIETSLKNLGVKKVNILYLHGPDVNTPLNVTLETMDKLHKEGVFQELGLSNFAAWQVVLAYHLCRTNGWIVPTVYQGMYNVLTRDVEPELFPALRAHNIRFYAYNPLAGGLLTGRYSSIDQIPKWGRFAKGTTIGKRYLDRFWHPTYFAAMDHFAKACEQVKISPLDASMRWLAYHSGLNTENGDAVILGASSVIHMNSNLEFLGKAKPLPQIVLKAADEAWAICKSECPRYFRS